MGWTVENAVPCRVAFPSVHAVDGERGEFFFNSVRLECVERNRKGVGGTCGCRRAGTGYQSGSGGGEEDEARCRTNAIIPEKARVEPRTTATQANLIRIC